MDNKKINILKVKAGRNEVARQRKRELISTLLEISQFIPSPVRPCSLLNIGAECPLCGSRLSYRLEPSNHTMRDVYTFRLYYQKYRYYNCPECDYEYAD